eukprot:m.22980 g.22980  ORF g.22980 m.22980 type:complete len:1157 (+) comp34531_c0_seq2:215-3685(+)
MECTERQLLLHRPDTAQSFGFDISTSPPFHVTAVADPSPAHSGALSVGDVLVRVNEQSVSALSHDQILLLLQHPLELSLHIQTRAETAAPTVPQSFSSAHLTVPGRHNSQTSNDLPLFGTVDFEGLYLGALGFDESRPQWTWADVEAAATLILQGCCADEQTNCILRISLNELFLIDADKVTFDAAPTRDVPFAQICPGSSAIAFVAPDDLSFKCVVFQPSLPTLSEAICAKIHSARENTYRNSWLESLRESEDAARPRKSSNVKSLSAALAMRRRSSPIVEVREETATPEVPVVPESPAQDLASSAAAVEAEPGEETTNQTAAGADHERSSPPASVLTPASVSASALEPSLEPHQQASTTPSTNDHTNPLEQTVLDIPRIDVDNEELTPRHSQTQEIDLETGSVASFVLTSEDVDEDREFVVTLEHRPAIPEARGRSSTPVKQLTPTVLSTSFVSIPSALSREEGSLHRADAQETLPSSPRDSAPSLDTVSAESAPDTPQSQKSNPSISIVQVPPTTAAVEDDDEEDFFALLKKQTMRAEIPDPVLPPTEEELAERAMEDGPLKWALRIEYLLESDNGRKMFAAYLKQTFCEENMTFYMDVQSLKDLGDKELKDKCVKIFEKYFTPQAVTPLNIDSSSKAIITRKVKDGEFSKDMFTAAQKQIFKLMKFDSYPRFLQSKEFEKSRKTAVKQASKREKLNQLAVPASSDVPSSPNGTPRESPKESPAISADRKKGTVFSKIFTLSRSASLATADWDPNRSPGGASSASHDPAAHLNVSTDSRLESKPKSKFLGLFSKRSSKSSPPNSPAVDRSSLLPGSPLVSRGDPMLSTTPRSSLQYEADSQPCTPAGDVVDTADASASAACVAHSRQDSTRSAGLEPKFTIVLPNDARCVVSVIKGASLLDCSADLLAKWSIPLKRSLLIKAPTGETVGFDELSEDYADAAFTLSVISHVEVVLPNGEHAKAEFEAAQSLAQVLEPLANRHSLVLAECRILLDDLDTDRSLPAETFVGKLLHLSTNQAGLQQTPPARSKLSVSSNCSSVAADASQNVLIPPNLLDNNDAANHHAQAAVALPGATHDRISDRQQSPTNAFAHIAAPSSAASVDTNANSAQCLERKSPAPVSPAPSSSSYTPRQRSRDGLKMQHNPHVEEKISFV